jgi:hypothetical protein
MNPPRMRRVTRRLGPPLLAALLAGCGAAPETPAADPDEIEKAVAKADLELEAAENGSALTSREADPGTRDSGS